MNERLVADPPPARKLNPEITPQLQEILMRALERDPRHRYATAHEMAWELEHPELVGVEESGRRGFLQNRLPGGRKLMIYLALALVPLLIFVLMIVLAKH